MPFLTFFWDQIGVSMSTKVCFFCFFLYCNSYSTRSAAAISTNLRRGITTQGTGDGVRVWSLLTSAMTYRAEAAVWCTYFSSCHTGGWRWGCSCSVRSLISLLTKIYFLLTDWWYWSSIALLWEGTVVVLLWKHNLKMGYFLFWKECTAQQPLDFLACMWK